MLFNSARLSKLGLTNRPVIHCGANVGEEFLLYQSLGLKPRMWIEANQDLAGELASNVGPDDLIIINAIGARTGSEVTFFVANNLQSSSVLPLSRHREIYPDVKYSKSSIVSLVALDDLWV